MSAVMVRTRPIPFSGPMVRAILDGRKTKTRRVVAVRREILSSLDHDLLAFDRMQSGYADGSTRAVFDYDGEPNVLGIKCPYGEPGDRLYVREAWTADFGHTFSDNIGAWWHEVPRSLRTQKAVTYLYYRADDSVFHAPDAEGDHFGGWEARRSTWVPSDDDLEDRRWIPSMFMPRWASRLTLELTEVRVERVRAISEADAIAEGVEASFAPGVGPATCRHAYRCLWDSLNAKRGYAWNSNPWVWVLGFKVVEP